mgnify:CR=1 FL=1
MKYNFSDNDNVEIVELYSEAFASILPEVRLVSVFLFSDLL